MPIWLDQGLWLFPFSCNHFSIPSLSRWNAHGRKVIYSESDGRPWKKVLQQLSAHTLNFSTLFGKMILLHKILAIKGFYYLFLLAIHRIGKTALIGNRLWTSLEAKILGPFRDWVGLARIVQEDQVPKCNDQHCQWLHPPFLFCFSCYWWSIQEDTIGKVWPGWKQKGTVVEIGHSNVKVFFCCHWIYVSRFWILQPMPFQKD